MLASATSNSVLRENLPVIQDGRVYAVAAVWRDAAPIITQLDDGRTHVVIITLAAAIVSALLLTFVFRTAQQRLTRQTVALLEATRRDPLRLEAARARLQFGDVRVETPGAQHLFEVQVDLGGLDPQTVRIELYADGISGSAPV